ncbi:MAG: alanine:cation symporter family protein, partial [Bacteroidales bacterium]|nr:alanine:cation symporter family protein [Bacteroidales bacterium]
MDHIIDLICGWIWSPVLVVLCLIAGLYFSFGLRFVQIRRLKTMVRLLFSSDKSDKSGVTSFQAFAMALSGRVGTGNIVGVATAIGFGGPGAIVWMWIVAFFGAGTAFAESTLAQVFKDDHDGQYRGGPAYYIEKGLHSKAFAVIFAIASVIGLGFLSPSIQSNGIAVSFHNTFGIEKWIVGVAVALLFALIIIGGVKRIAKIAEIVAPFMALIYIILSIVILIANASEVPAALSNMIKSALGLREMFSGIIGCTISMGVRRGLFSNEAGQGSGAIVAASAEVSHPVKQGLVQAFSVYIDTLMVCTATAVMILACQTYNVIDPHGNIIFNSPVAELGQPDVSYTTAAIATFLGDNTAGIIVSIALFFFAFTTAMAYYYNSETNVSYLFGKGKHERLSINILRAAVILALFAGTVTDASTIWGLVDIGIGMMAWINIIAILLLSPIVFRCLHSYEKQEKEGKDPVFDPDELNIKN